VYANQLSTLAIIQVGYLKYWTVKLLCCILIVKNIETTWGNCIKHAERQVLRCYGVMKVENDQNEIFL